MTAEKLESRPGGPTLAQQFLKQIPDLSGRNTMTQGTAVIAAEAHTPGPWESSPAPIDGDRLQGYTVFQVGHQVVARCINPDRSTEEHEANARLIAAAPDLLVVAEEYHTALDLLFSKLIVLDPTFFPSQSGQPWDAVVKGHAVIAAAKPVPA